MNPGFFGKIGWRLDFILTEGWRKRPLALIYNLLPSGHKWRDGMAFKLAKSDPKLKNLIKIMPRGKEEMLVDLGIMKLVCNQEYPFSTFVHEYFEIIYPYFSRGEDKLFLSRRISPEGPYEKSGAVLGKGDYVIDAGANVGMFSLLASVKTGPSGKIFAFEPVPKTRRLLARNIELNNFKNIEIVPLALGEMKGELTLFSDPKNLQTPSGVSRTGLEEIKSRQTTLDEFVEQSGISKIDFIKADIEGMERNLLRGTEQTLKK